MCEDYPCCGHTDGLGCDWVSPNEVQPCQVCIDARVSRPYHKNLEGSCPTEYANARELASLNVPANFECDECGDLFSIHPDFDNLCYPCGFEAVHEAEAYYRDTDYYAY